jgi:hypothetical protein
MFKKSIIALSLFTSFSAMANFNLSQNQKNVVCDTEENTTITLSADRRTLQFSNGSVQKITKMTTDYETYATYKSANGILSLSDKGNTFQYSSDLITDIVNCQ